MTTEESMSALYEMTECPACGKPFERPRPGWRGEDTVYIPGHTVTRSAYGPVCWLGGWTLAEAKAMLRMQAENGGRLMSAAHP